MLLVFNKIFSPTLIIPLLGFCNPAIILIIDVLPEPDCPNRLVILPDFAINFTSNDTYTNTLVFIIASATIFQSFNVVDFYFQSKVMSKFVVYVNIISLFLSSIVKVVLINDRLLSFLNLLIYRIFDKLENRKII